LRKREALFLKLIPENVLREPIEFIFSYHYRLVQIIAAMSVLLKGWLFRLVAGRRYRARDRHDQNLSGQ